MAFKFLGRPEVKQRILRIDLDQTTLPNHREGAERAIVVTAEADRLTYFWNHSSGLWRFHTRPHSRLRPLAVAPAGTNLVPWSRRNGVAVDGDLAAIVFKRELAEGLSPQLFLDVLVWEEARSEWRFATEQQPITVPLGPQNQGLGVDVWAWLKGADLSIVVQTWVDSSILDLPTSPLEPRLTLIQSSIDPADLPALRSRDAWVRTDLDVGGFDLDARFDGDRIWVVHRRTAASMSLPFVPVGNNVVIAMLDDAGRIPVDIDESPLVADMPPMVLVSCDWTGSQGRIEADDLPSVEHPQLQSIDPLMITGDRLRSVSIRALRRDAGPFRLRPKVEQADKVAIWRGARDWRMEPIGPVDHSSWPLNLSALAPAQWMVDTRDDCMAFATLLALKPTYLWRFDVTLKGVELTFGREDRHIGGIACDRFLVKPDLPTGSVNWIGMSVLDLGHEQIALDAQGESAFPIENTQFHGVVTGTAVREGGGSLGFRFPTVNTLGGLLVAHQDARHGLCAYVGMGDGGGRVIFESDVRPIEPTVDKLFKELPPEVVSGPGGSGSAWVTLEAADFVPSHLPGYLAPYGDVLRSLPPPRNQLEYGLVFAWPDLVLGHFRPRSLGGGFQPLLDVLPLANLLLVPGQPIAVDDLNQSTLDVDESDANAMQAALSAQVPATAPFRSDGAQPFSVEFTISPGQIQAKAALTLGAQVTDPGVTPAGFTWTFTQPPGSSGFSPVSMSGAEVDFSFPLPGAWSVRLQVVAIDGRQAEITTRLDVTPSLWSQIWSAYRNLDRNPDLRIDTVAIPLMHLGTVALQLMHHRIEYRVGPDGRRESVHIEYLPEHDCAFRFDAGREAQQGRTMLRLPITLSSVDGRFTGILGSALTLREVKASLALERPYTLGVVTSDRRSFDVLHREMYADIDAAAPEEADVETIRESDFEPGRAFRMEPNALAAKPAGDSTLCPPTVDVDVELTRLASRISFLVGFVLALGLVSLIAAPLLTALALRGPIPFLALVSFAVLVELAVSAGLALLFVQLVQQAANDLANTIARDSLSSPDKLEEIEDALDQAGVINYAGEGLAEAIAIRAIQEAIRAGHSLEPPVHEQPDPDNPGRNHLPTGRERFRSQFFETIVVGEGVCRVLLRVR